MTSQIDKAKAFHALHVKGNPVVLFNIWDAGGAKAIAKEGAKAIATGSWSVADAHGFADGEGMPLDFALPIYARIAETVDLPFTVDFEGGYAVEPEAVATNVSKLIRTGAIGLNFEDRVVGGEGLHSINSQAGRIKAIRAAADDAGIPLFINARTDLFLGSDPETHEGRVAEALDRHAAYQEAGASGFFIPGLAEPSLIQQIVENCALPVNVMMLPAFSGIAALADLGVGRVSFGPGPYRTAMSDLKSRFTEQAG